jgi:hypothetical protein
MCIIIYPYRERNKSKLRHDMDLAELSEESKAKAEKLLLESKSLKKNLGVLKMTLTKRSNSTRDKDEAIELEAEERSQYERDETTKNLKLILFNHMSSNLMIINKYNQHESMRKLMCSILPLMLPPASLLIKENISKADIVKLLATNGRSKLIEHCFNKADILESNKESNNKSPTLLMIEDAIKPIDRLDRIDKCPAQDKMSAELHWLANTEVSPNAKDFIRIKDAEGKTGEKQMIHYQYRTNHSIHVKFQADTKIKMCQTIHVDCKPSCVRKGKDDTCVCDKCAGFDEAKKAFTHNSALLSKPFQIMRILGRFLFGFITVMIYFKKEIKGKQKGLFVIMKKAQRQERVKAVFRIISVFQVSWGKPRLSINELCKSGIRISEMINIMLCRNAMPKEHNRGKPLCYGECDKSNECKECFVGDTLSRLVVNVPIFKGVAIDPRFLWKESDRMTYNSYSNKKKVDGEEEVKKMSLLIQHRVHPKTFLEYFMNQFKMIARHRATLARAKFAHQENDRNMLPTDLAIDVDFSENFGYSKKKKVQIQGEHWSGATLTLFICVIMFLCYKTWNAAPMDLKIGQEVSVKVQTNDGGGDVFIWGKVTENQLIMSTTIKVEHIDGIVRDYPLEDIRVRKLVSVPVIIVSDDKKHDSYFVRFFFMNSLLGKEGWLYKQKQEPGLAGRITRIFVRSDGAPSHFKQSGTIHYMTFLCVFFGLYILWTYGAPGHGKGTWDGLGGIVKNTAGDLLRALDSFMCSPYSVYEVIYELFASESATTRFANDPTIKIKQWYVYFLKTSDITRPVKPPKQPKMTAAEKSLAKEAKAKAIADALANGEEWEDDIVDESNKFSPLKAFYNVGVRKIFSFEFLHRNGVGVRVCPCCCHFCIRGYRKDGFGTMPTGCLSQEPYQYLVCQRLDEEWVTETEALMKRLSLRYERRLKADIVVALASNRLADQSSSSFFIAFDIARIVAMYDTEEERRYSVSMYNQKDNKFIYECKDALTVKELNFSEVRYILSDNVLQEDGTVLLDQDCLQSIIFNCFNGEMEENL